MDNEFLEKVIIKTMLTNKDFMFLLANIFEKRYFDDFVAAEIFEYCKRYVDEYKDSPSKDIIIGLSEDKELQTKINSFFTELDSLDISIEKQYDFIFNETNKFLKLKALSYAIMDSVSIIENETEITKVRDLIENALCKDLTIDLGLDYFKDLKIRLDRIFNSSQNRVPTYFPTLDEYLVGGFPPFTLSVALGKVHGFKSNLLINIAARQVLHGHNVLILTLEMSEDAVAQRFDSIYTSLDINRIYISSSTRKEFIKRISHVAVKQDKGKLIIKDFPTGQATINDYKIFIRELKMRGIDPSIIYVDYVNLMKPSYGSKNDLYSDVKKIAEELRSLSFEYCIPVVSVSQLNREGALISFDSVDFTYTSESYGLPAVCDFMCILGIDEDRLIYENELQYKIVKNRLGGRVGDINTLYYDTRSLKMYDVTEEKLWYEDATQTGDERNHFEKS